jgi:hypothetical protein
MLVIVVSLLTLANRLERRFNYRGETAAARKTDALAVIATEARG